MKRTVYTNYWVNERDDVKKRHGTFESEERAIDAVLAWWELHNEQYHDITYHRTNTGALEIIYGDPNYYYRIEPRKSSEPLPKTSYRLKSKGEIEALRKKHMLDEDTFIFDELAEPYRDRIIVAMGDSALARSYTYTKDGKPIIKALAKSN